MSPVPAPAPVDPDGGGGGHPTTLYDATSGDAAVIADDGAVTIQDDVDFVSHGNLDLDHGFTPTGDAEGRLPTWYDPANTQFDQGGWFAFGYDTVKKRVAQHWGSGPDERASLLADEDLGQFNMYAAEDQGGDAPILNLWDYDRVISTLSVWPTSPVQSNNLQANDNGVSIWRSDDAAHDGESMRLTVSSLGTHGGTPSRERFDVWTYSYDGFGATELWAAGVNDPGFTDKLFHVYASLDDTVTMRLRESPNQGTTPLFIGHKLDHTQTFRIMANGSMGVWGHAAPASQPVAGTTAADAIACLKAYGLMAA